jgi:hypothetical protein
MLPLGLARTRLWQHCSFHALLHNVGVFGGFSTARKHLHAVSEAVSPKLRSLFRQQGAMALIHLDYMQRAMRAT